MKKILGISILALSVTACSGMSNTEQRTLSGGAIGAAAGAGIVAIAGANPIWGALGGAAVGAAGGYIYDQYEKHEASEKRQAYNSGYQAGQDTNIAPDP